MKDVKKLMAVMSVLVMAAVFSACGSSNDSTTAGATGDTGGSPRPDGGAELRAKCTSIAGTSLIRSSR